ncbi:MAG: hypothetical protein KM312_02060 [Hydrogenibacillus schlegelii]|uniref:Flagellar biosynthesis protein FlhF n=1 Tax=Hydrogenibacillus schlegelii TaxID=1484 RepID=A0A947GAT3_HYDSH|nr:hypothetical protein [Hydrogenibacillus schlegelii]
MKLKQFVAATEAEALALVRAEWGERAIILASRRERPKGLLGWLRRGRVVVVAAYDEGDAPRGGDRAPSAVPPSGPAPEPEDGAAGLEARRQAVLAAMERTGRVRAGSGGAVARRPAGGPAAVGALLAAGDPPAEASVPSWAAALGGLPPNRRAFVPAFWSTAEALFQHGVEARWVERLHAAVLRRRPETAGDPAAMRQAAAAILAGWLKQKVGPPRRPARLVALVGPTGVGKTTTVAKLAARDRLGGGGVAFITADTFRVAAVEQLRTYADILGVPFAVAYSPGEAARSAAHHLAAGRTVYVDTAGRNYFSPEAADALRPVVEALRPLDDGALFLLTLALTHQWEDNARLIERFSALGVDALVFTKFDEAPRLGQVLNAVLRFPVRAVYLADGQNVPDDLRPLAAAALVDGLLGGAGA